jgi:hypothetical protein
MGVGKRRRVKDKRKRRVSATSSSRVRDSRSKGAREK